MWSLPQPRRSAVDAYRICVNSVADNDLRTRLQGVEATIVADADAFATAAAATRLHTIPQQDSVNGTVTRAEMSDLYDRRMAKQGLLGRVVYDELFSAAPYGRCPLCGQRDVSTLDHHLPKSRYPSLAVAPPNLVPACAPCNHKKLNSVPTSSVEESIHPYFDNVDAERWLHADVVEATPPALVFSVAVPAPWNEILTARVRRQFSTLRLGSLYAAHAAAEIVNIRHLLTDVHASGGAAAVRAHLVSVADSHARVRNNSWQIATYRALAESDWYCDAGFAAS